MAKDNPATPTVNEAQIISIPFTLASGKIGKVYATNSQIEYYNITTTGSVATGAAGYTRVKRNNSARTVYGGVWDTTGKSSTMRNSDYYLPTRLNGNIGGKPIIIPTQLRRGGVATKPFRTTTLNFSGSGIILADISAWLAANLKAKEPAWFQTASGSRYAVAPKGSITDLNPGRSAAAGGGTGG